MNREETTRMLSELLEKRLTNRYNMWAAEVSFDQHTDKEIRIDYVAFKLKPVHRVTVPTSVELGKFDCYEVKSCMDDVKSGHGLNFIGDENWMVTTDEVAEKLRGTGIAQNCGVLVPNKPMTSLIVKYDYCDILGGRQRPASEILWQMVVARNNRLLPCRIPITSEEGVIDGVI